MAHAGHWPRSRVAVVLALIAWTGILAGVLVFVAAARSAPGDMRTVIVSLDHAGVSDRPQGPLEARLEDGTLPDTPMLATVVDEGTCTLNATGVSRCLNELRMSDGGTLDVWHNHRMPQIPCMEAGEQVLVEPESATS
jgi:hypothetical protein